MSNLLPCLMVTESGFLMGDVSMLHKDGLAVSVWQLQGCLGTNLPSINEHFICSILCNPFCFRSVFIPSYSRGNDTVLAV